MTLNRWLMAFCAVAALCSYGHGASAHDPGPLSGTRPASPAAQPPQSMHVEQSAMDPVIRALLIAMAARMLREAAASPDPMSALGESLERTLAAAAANPETLRMIEAMTGQAFKEVPEELRQALISFAASMFIHARRELLQNRKRAP